MPACAASCRRRSDRGRQLTIAALREPIYSMCMAQHASRLVFAALALLGLAGCGPASDPELAEASFALSGGRPRVEILAPTAGGLSPRHVIVDFVAQPSGIPASCSLDGAPFASCSPGQAYDTSDGEH